MSKISNKVDKMRSETAVKNEEIMDAIFDNVDYSNKEISLAVLNHHNTCMINTLERRGIDSKLIKDIVKDLVSDVVDYLEEEFDDDDIPVITCAIASQLSLSVFESFVYANKRVEEEAKAEQESKNQVDKNETARRVAEVYKEGKVSNEDLANMIECNSITLGGIAEHLGMDIANEVLRIASENLENKKEDKEEVNKEKDMDDFYELLSRKDSMSFDEFSKEMNSFSEEVKLSIMKFVEELKRNEMGRNVRVIKVPIKENGAIRELLEALLKEAK